MVTFAEQPQSALEAFKEEFLDTANRMNYHSAITPHSLKGLIVIYTFGWMDSLLVNHAPQPLVDMWERTVSPLLTKDWMPDKSWTVPEMPLEDFPPD